MFYSSIKYFDPDYCKFSLPDSPSQWQFTNSNLSDLVIRPNQIDPKYAYVSVAILIAPSIWGTPMVDG
jgi:hypothetical protein